MIFTLHIFSFFVTSKPVIVKLILKLCLKIRVHKSLIFFLGVCNSWYTKSCFNSLIVKSFFFTFYLAGTCLSYFINHTCKDNLQILIKADNCLQKNSVSSSLHTQIIEHEHFQCKSALLNSKSILAVIWLKIINIAASPLRNSMSSLIFLLYSSQDLSK